MKPKIYNILRDSIERGIQRGYRRSFKHTETPGEDFIFDCIETEIFNEISEYFTFDNSND